jgi:hypothetical protein
MFISLFAKDKFYKLIICPILLIHFCIEHFYKPTPVEFLNIPWMINTECSSADGKLPVNVSYSFYQEKIKSIIIVNFLIQHVCILLMNTSHSCTCNHLWLLICYCSSNYIVPFSGSSISRVKNINPHSHCPKTTILFWILH